MELIEYYPLLFTAAALFLFSRRFLLRWRGGAGGGELKLPPSPPAIPIIGHFHLLRKPHNLTLAALADRFGPVIRLRLGSTPALVVSSPDAIEEILTKHDAVFANHPTSHASRAFRFESVAMFFSPYGAHWRKLRRMTSVELLCGSRVADLAGVRKTELLDMARRMLAGPGTRGEVVISVRVFEMMYNMLAMMVAGRRFFGEEMWEEEAEMGRAFMAIFDEIVDVIFSFNPSDFFPAVAWMDLMGVERRVEKVRLRLNRVLNDMVEDQRSKRASAAAAKGGGDVAAEGEMKRTLIDVMLAMQEVDPVTYTDDVINGQIMSILVGGTETMTKIVNITMLILLCHPEVMKKVRDEIDAKVEAGRFVEESDLPRLTYLNCVILEVMRLGYFGDPPPHLSSEDCVVQGYHVPRGCITFINTWKTNRDPKIWEEPMSFKPERFGGQIAWRDGFKFIPFGAGRRVCPGESLAVRAMPYAIAFLIQCFDWDPMTEDEVDLSALLGMHPPRGRPTLAKYRVRSEMVDALSSLCE